jgi:hypothetical protein
LSWYARRDLSSSARCRRPLCQLGCWRDSESNVPEIPRSRAYHGRDVLGFGGSDVEVLQVVIHRVEGLDPELGLNERERPALDDEKAAAATSRQSPCTSPPASRASQIRGDPRLSHRARPRPRQRTAIHRPRRTRTQGHP